MSNLSKQEIENGNRLIAEFMGRSFAMSHISDYKEGKLPDSIRKALRYHSSWQQLMPVVEKINNALDEQRRKAMRHDWDDGEDKDLDDPTGWRAWSYRQIHLSTDIKPVWIKVIEAIQWFNSQSKK